MNSEYEDIGKPLLNILVAHMPEAKPLIAQFELKPAASTTHKVFSNREGLSLAVSGNGKDAMVQAVDALAQLQGDAVAPAWLNIGIAGHGGEALGKGVLITKIRDAQTGVNFYPTPMRVSKSGGTPVSELLTVPKVERRYREEIAYDMEGSAFWERAAHHGQLDQVQCYKIVSDNPKNPVDGFSIGSVKTLFAGVSSPIAELVTQMQETACGYRHAHDLPEIYSRLLTNYHFTVSQRIQLAKLWRNWLAFGRPQSVLVKLQDLLGSDWGQEECAEPENPVAGVDSSFAKLKGTVSSVKAAAILRLMQEAIHESELTASAG